MQLIGVDRVALSFLPSLCCDDDRDELFTPTLSSLVLLTLSPLNDDGDEHNGDGDDDVDCC